MYGIDSNLVWAKFQRKLFCHHIKRRFRYVVCYCVLYWTEAKYTEMKQGVLIDFSLTVKAATLIFITGRGSAIPSAEERKSGFIYNLVKS